MSSGDEEALRLADLFECIPIASGSLDNIESAGRELRRLVAEREADRAVMRKALFHLEHASGESNGIDENESGNLRALVMSLNAAISSLKARTQ